MKKIVDELFLYLPSLSHPSSSKEYAHDKFPSISITGNKCSLNCPHCSGKLLSLMKDSASPRELVNICKELKDNGGVGCLISGGCTPEGKVPLRRYSDALKKVKNMGLKVVVHTGLVDEEDVEMLREARIESVSIDVVGSNSTLRDIYHLNLNVSDIDESLKLLVNAGLKITPHVLIGLHYGEILGEKKAIELAASHEPDALILIVMTPIRGTPMEKVKPPSPLQVSKLIAYARSKLKETPIVLGCMRPSGRYREQIDTLAVNEGVNGIAFPSKAVLSYIKRLGVKTRYMPYCCSLIAYDSANRH